MSDKLVRTRLGIPEERLTNIELHTEEGIKYLKKKIVEEAMEVRDAESIIEIAREIGDLADVIDTLIVALGFEPSYIKALRTVKNEENGGFCRESYYTPYPTGVILDKESSEKGNLKK